jgi:hypothetical protein
VSGEGGFLARWARRKERAKTGIDPDAPAPPPAEPATPAEPALAPEELERRLAALPKIEEIGPATDVRVFLESWVPAALRQQALRHVWTTDPKISTFIETADYQWDFTVPGGAPGCGPLEPDFDATDFVKRLFNEHEPSPLQDCDTSSRSTDAGDPASDTAPHNDPDRNDVSDFGDRGETVPHFMINSAHAPVSNHAAPPREKNLGSTAAVTSSAETHPPRRRHGGALPA